MNKGGDYITEEKRKSLVLELEDLKGPQRKKIIEALEFAKSLGDLSENAEYHQAREDQGKLEERILKIDSILQNSTVISGERGDSVEVGSTVVVAKEGSTDKKTYHIVGSEEADTLAGKISNQSPFGQALFGKKKGESFSVTTPGGVVNYKIIEVS